MHLHEALFQIAVQLDLDPRQLVAYAKEDTLLGFYDGGGQYAVPFKEDGQLLYALVRALKPDRVLEVGTSQGGSAHHIALALEANRTGGMVTTVDINPSSSIAGIPYPLVNRVAMIIENIDVMISDRRAYLGEFDFIHEDGAHSVHQVHNIYGHLPQLMPQGGVIVSHDTSTGVGVDVFEGIAKAGYGKPPSYEYDGSPCGFSVMRYGGVK